VTVISQTLRKKDDGLRFGAHDYFAMDDPSVREQLKGRFDLILNTISTNSDLTALLEMLDLDGTLVNLGIPSEPDQLDEVVLGAARRSVAATKNGGIPQTQEMLNFCGEHKIGATIERISIDQINDAYKRVLDSDVRYRFVIDIASFEGRSL
jgi:uncharacterized zinc-type alcohol dehydrogenase-like protein